MSSINEITTQFPILIGSRAVDMHNEKSDYDIIIPEKYNKNVFPTKSYVIDFFSRNMDLKLLKFLHQNIYINDEMKLSFRIVEYICQW